MKNVINVNNLKKDFILHKKLGFFKKNLSTVSAVKDISFDVYEGDILAFIGPNGAGKSTTIKMLTGILKPTNGNVKVLGLDPQMQRKKLAYHIGTVFGQKSQLWFHLPPIDSFKLLGSIYDVPNNKLKKRIDYLSEMMGIRQLLTIPVKKLSLGQRIKCEISASLLHNPKIIFLDEPTIGLDVVAKKNLRTLIKRINKEEKATIFLTSHDIGDIEKLSKRVIIINHGSIILDQDINSLKYNYDNKKIVLIRYEDKINFDNLDFNLNIISKTNMHIKIELDTEKNSIDKIIPALFKLGKVQDISVSSRPLEDIISDICIK